MSSGSVMERTLKEVANRAVQNLENIQPRYRVTVHPHLLRLAGEDVEWQCDGADLEGGCEQGCAEFGKYPGLKRFRCDLCDYDLCQVCKEAYLPRFKVTVHPHPLLPADQDIHWRCDGSRLEGGCKQGCTGFGKYCGWKRFRCDPCDYDLCQVCKDAYLEFNEADTSVKATTLTPTSSCDSKDISSPKKWYSDHSAKGDKAKGQNIDTPSDAEKASAKFLDAKDIVTLPDIKQSSTNHSPCTKCDVHLVPAGTQSGGSELSSSSHTPPPKPPSAVSIPFKPPTNMPGQPQAMGSKVNSMTTSASEEIPLSTATYRLVPVEKDSEEFWALEEKFHAALQGRNEDYVSKRQKKNLKPLTFVLKVDDGFFGSCRKGVYVSRYADYTFKYSNRQVPLEPGETCKVVMFKTLPGCTKHFKTRPGPVDPTAGYDSHSSPSFLEWYLFHEDQLYPDYILTILAREDSRTAADD